MATTSVNPGTPEYAVAAATPGLNNVYTPAPAFTITGGAYNALPDACPAHIGNRQMNAVASEMLALAEEFAPNGTWDMTKLDNMATAFKAWITGVGPVSLQSDVLSALNWVDGSGNQLTSTANIATTADLAAAIAAQPADKYLASAAYNATTNILTLTLTDGTTVGVNMTTLLNDVPSVSATAGNLIEADPAFNNRALLTAQQIVDGINAAPVAKCDLTNSIVKSPVVALAAGPNAVTNPADNYGTNRDTATAGCPIVTPYAETGLSGVVELLNSTVDEASKDHDMGLLNDDANASPMNNRALMDKNRVVTADTWVDLLNNNFLIESNRTYDIPSARFPTLKSLETYLKNRWFAGDVTITVNLAAGVQPSGGLLFGHAQGNRVIVNGAAMVGAIPVGADFPSNGVLTGAGRLADYNLAKAPLVAKYGTVLQGSVNTNNGLLPFKYRNICIQGSFSMNGVRDPSGGIFQFDNVLIDHAAALNGLTLTNAAISSSRNLFVIGTGGSNVSVTMSDFTCIGLIACYGNASNFLVSSNSKALITGYMRFAGSGQSNLSNTTGGKSVLIGTAALPYDFVDSAAFNMLTYDAGSNVSIGGNNADLVVNRAASANLVSSGGGVVSRSLSGALNSIVISNAPTGIAVEIGDFIFPAAAGSTTMAITDHTLAGISCEQGRVSIPFGTTYAANTQNIFASDVGSVNLNGGAATLTSPPVGIVGNNNSLIFA